MNKETTVDDFVVEGFVNARDALFDVFNTTDMSVLADYAKLLAALRMQPKNVIDQASKPVILRLFQASGCDPKSPVGREKMLPLVDLLALGVQDAHHIILDQVGKQQKNRQALAMGNTRLLKS